MSLSIRYEVWPTPLSDDKWSAKSILKDDQFPHGFTEIVLATVEGLDEPAKAIQAAEDAGYKALERVLGVGSKPEGPGPLKWSDINMKFVGRCNDATGAWLCTLLPGHPGDHQRLESERSSIGGPGMDQWWPNK